MYWDEIVRLRAEKRWSQDELAQRAGVSRNSIWNAESQPKGPPHKHKRLDRTTAHKIAVALGVHDEEITMVEASLRVENGSEKELIEWLKKQLPDGFEIIRTRKGSIIVDLILTPRNAARLKEAIERNELAEFGNVEFTLESEEEEGLDAIAKVEQPQLDAGARRSGQQVSHITWKVIAARAAIAASLLTCGMMLDRFLIGQGGPDKVQILVATADASFSPLAGPNEKLPQLLVKSPISGFLTVATLSEGRRPLIYPRIGGQAFRITDGHSEKAHLLPADTTAALFVVTETPATSTLSESEGKLADYGPDDIDAIKSVVQAALEENGFRRMAFGSARFQNAGNN